MKQVKLNLLAIIGMMVAVGTVAFTPAKNANTWYEISPTGELSELFTEPGGDCNMLLDDGVECAVELRIQVPESTPRSSINPSDIVNSAFKEPN